MHRFLRIDCLLTFVVLCVVAATGQVRHVTTVNPLSRSQQGYVEVYEFDYVDVQPQFPGGEHGLINFMPTRTKFRAAWCAVSSWAPTAR